MRRVGWPARSTSRRWVPGCKDSGRPTSARQWPSTCSTMTRLSLRRTWGGAASAAPRSMSAMPPGTRDSRAEAVATPSRSDTSTSQIAREGPILPLRRGEGTLSERMDGTHREFVILVDGLLTAGDAEFPALFEEFIRHTEAHFAEEHKSMQA